MVFNSFSFSEPLYLLVLPVILGIIIFWGIKKSGISKFHRIFFTAIRSIVIILFALALAGMSLRSSADLSTTVFAVDISASAAYDNEAKTRLSQFLWDVQEEKEENHQLGVVCFGKTAVVETMPDLKKRIGEIYSFVEADYSNIADGLSLARSIIPDESKKRITLISDGLENINNALSQAALLAADGIAVDGYYLRNEIEHEVQLTHLNVPKFIRMDMSYNVEAGIYSVSENQCIINIYKGSSLIASDNVTLRTGENNLTFKDVADTGGFSIYRAEIIPENDLYKENNKYYAYSYTGDAPNVLILEKNGSGVEIEDIMKSADVTVTRTDASAPPSSLERLSAYDCVIISDVSADDMPNDFLNLLETYVKNLGGGVMTTGGENSYGPGSYKNTVLETILPVNMELKDKSQAPDLAMIILTDRSGSMSMGNYGVSKMELAKEAAIRAVDALSDLDKLGVIAFDDQFIWASEITVVEGNRDVIKNRIANISEGGGTSILPGLREAYNALLHTDAKIKHIILMTDGQAEQTGYDSLISSMNEAGITLSTVAVGSDADRKLLKNLADDGLGRYYFSDEFTDLPQIFAKETMIAGKEFLNNREFYPIADNYHPILNNIDSVPLLLGYVSTTEKPRADVILKSDKDEPIIAAWQYGLGRTAAVTFDLDNKWSLGWLNADEGVKIIKNTVSWVLKKQITTEAVLNPEILGDKTKLTLTMPDEEGFNDMETSYIRVTVIDMALNEYQVNFTRQSPGMYTGMLDTISEGAYIASLEIGRKDEKTDNVSLGLNIPYSKEYDVTKRNSGRALIEQIVKMTGGIMLETPEEVFREFDDAAFSENSVKNWLLTASLILFLADIAIRRFKGVSAALERSFVKISEKAGAALSEAKLSLEKKVEKEPAKIYNKKIKNEKVDEFSKHKPGNAEETKSTSYLLLERKKKSRR